MSDDVPKWLGLVEINAAIAAELRRMADECATMFDERPGTMVGMGKGMAAVAIVERLRKRADDLEGK